MGAVDEYFATLDIETRAAFEHVRKLTLELAPDAVQGTSYGVVARFELSSGTIRFTAGHPLPDDAVRNLVRFRLAEIDAGRS